MQFERLTLQDLERVRPYLDYFQANTCDYTLGTMFMWRNFYQMKGCFTEDGFFSKLHDEHGNKYYNLPLSENPEHALQVLYDHARKPLRFCTVPESYLPLLKKVFPACDVEESPDFNDYLYRAEDLIGLHGKKLSGQRNQISQFKRNVESWRFEPLTTDNLPRVIEDFQNSSFFTGEQRETERAENHMVLDVLDNPAAYNMFGAVLIADERIVGFTLAEIVGNTLYIHIEKADRSCKGAYQMLVNQSAMTFSTPEVEFINREDDMGDPGLRAAKLSYHPVAILKKYIVTVT